MNASMLALCMLLIDDPDDQEKFQFIYDNYGDDMLRAAQSVVRDFNLAEDAVQNSFIRIASVIKDIDMSNNPRSFVITVAKNAAKDIVAKYEREKCCFDTYSTYYESSKVEMHKKIENEDIVEKISQFVMTLKPKYAEVFVLRFFHELQYKDIEKVLNVPEATLRKRMQRLKEKLTEYLKGD